MARQKFYFVTGEMVCTQTAHTLLDAWLSVETQGFRNGAEFTRRENNEIAAYDNAGNLLARRTWLQWHNELMTDTYGTDWQEKLEHAERLTR